MSKKKKKKRMIMYNVSEADTIQQGDIFKDVRYICDFKQSDNDIEIVELTFPYVMVVSQSCDMNYASELLNCEDSPESKMMFSVLVVPLFERETIISGEHLKELLEQKVFDFKIPPEFISSEDRKVIKDGFHYRYHEISFPTETSIPDCIIDLKSFFTISLSSINRLKTNRIGRLNEWASQQIVNKLSAFLSRVGLPDKVIKQG